MNDNPRFSIIMPSFLGEYKGAARNRGEKIHRAIESCLEQRYIDFELIIVADGCEETFSIIENNYSDPRISCSLIPKQKIWSGAVRNRGIKDAKGDYIVYLDIDDRLGVDHLKKIREGMMLAYDQFKFELHWFYFNDLILKKQNFVERVCDVMKKGKNGTSNLCHKRELKVFWRGDDYAHDWHFINDLSRASNQYIKIGTPEYFVCHIPGVYDV